MKRSDLLDAFEYVGSSAPYECTALINPTTGEVLGSDAWYEHEEQSLDHAIRVWCEENGVPLTD